VCYSTKLEKLQLDAARIVTGLPIFSKTDKLYSGILFPLNVKLKLYLTSVLENNIISVLFGLTDINLFVTSHDL
jgi:hypothetical protein